MMSVRYTEKYFVVCFLVLFPVINAVAEISLAETERLVKDCNTDEMKKSCYEKCGPKHACISGQCICFEDSTSPEEVSDEESQEVESSEENNSGAEIVYEDESPNNNAHVLKTLQFLISQYRNTEGNSNIASSGESNSVDENLIAKPALRHHIAHFCPNLDKARVCIRKCMKVNLPAFCGKDHVCYCGQKVENYIDVNKLASVHSYGNLNPYQDLYERYFGYPTISESTETNSRILKNA